MDDALEHVCSTIIALACDDGFSHTNETETDNGGVDRNLKNTERSIRVLKKQSVSYVTSLSWSLLCELESKASGRVDPVMLGREMISRYHDGMRYEMDECRKYILGLLLARSIHVVCSNMAGCGGDVDLMGECVRRALMGPVYHLVVGTEYDDWMHVVDVFVGSVDVSGCWDVLVDIIRPTMGNLGGSGKESRMYSCHIHMACIGMQKASTGVFVEYMHGNVFSGIIECVKEGKSSTVPLVLLHDIIQSVARQGEEDARRVLNIVWNVCCNHVEPMDALGLLVQYIDAMIVTHVCEYDDENLWDVLEWGLLNTSGLQKKRGMYVLERLIDAMPSSTARQWKRFIQLFTALDDTSLHLFKAHWSEMDVLHPDENSEEEGEGEERLPFFWIQVIWRMALLHQQTTAQKLALVSFLNRKWSIEDVENISPDFVSDVLIPALGQAGIYAGIHADAIDQGIDVFFTALADSRTSDEAFCEVLTPFLKRMKDSQQHYVIKFCSRVVDILCERRGRCFEASAEFLDMIGAAARAQPVYGSNCVSIACQRSLMILGGMCFRIEHTFEFERVLSWIGAIPNGLICKGGILHETGVTVFHDILSRSSFNMESMISICLSGGVLERECARKIGALVKASMLLCETQDAILEHISKYIESEILIASDEISSNACYLLSSMMESFIPLEGKKLLVSTYNEYVISQCKMLSSKVLPLLVRRVLAKIEHISHETIHNMYSYCLNQQRLAGDVQMENIEAFLPPDVIVLREMLALQLGTICSIVQAICCTCIERFTDQSVIESMYHPLWSILTALVNTYQDIVPYSAEQVCEEEEHSTGSYSVATQSILEVKILGLRLLASIGESLKALRNTRGDTFLETSCMSGLEKMLALSVESLKQGYPREKVESFMKDVETAGKKKNRTRSSNTAQGWLSLCSWRSIAVSLACLQGSSNSISNVIIYDIICYGRYCLYNAPDGDTAIIPIVRCFRCLIPLIVRGWKTNEDPKEKTCLDECSPDMESMLSSISSGLAYSMGTQTRGRLGLSAAIVSTVAHPSLFSSEALQDPRVSAMHCSGGIIHSSIRKLVAVGQKYNRLLIQVSCHLGSLLLKQPRLGTQYRCVLEELALSGFGNESSLFSLRDEVLDKTTATEISRVLTNVPQEIATAYAQAECAPRVGVICLLYQWTQNAVQGDAECMQVCRMLWESLYALSKSDKDLSQTVYTHGGPIHKKKLRLWQALTVLSPCIEFSNISNQLSLLLRDMQCPNAVTVKQYQEIIAATLVIRKPALVREIIFPDIDDYSSQRKDANPCLFSIISAVIFHFDGHVSSVDGEHPHPYCEIFSSLMDHDTWKKLLMDSLDHLLPWIGAFPHANRTFAQIIVWNLLKSYPEAAESDPLLSRMILFLDSNKDLKRLHVRLGVVHETLERFSVVNALKPASILCNPHNTLVRKVTNQQICENAPLPLVHQVLDYLLEQRQDTREKVSDTIKKAGIASYESVGVVSENEQGKNFWQRKITPKDQLQSALQMTWKHALGTLALQENRTMVRVDSFEAFHYQNQTPAEESNRQDIVIVASLIDRVPNLAGLTRTCEIFRARKLILGDISVQDDPEFASISVSANNWCPLEEVKPDHVCSWLQKMKHMGYRLVGLEQTDESVSLPEYTFDKKTILMLGAEKEGIPANILNILDDTIEIPQLGVIRSLNVHVSAAITLYQYTCQQ